MCRATHASPLWKVFGLPYKKDLTYGCGSAIASSTMFVEMLKGLTMTEALDIKDKDIAEALDLPPIKLHCSVLAEDSIKKALKDWDAKQAHRKHNQ